MERLSWETSAIDAQLVNWSLITDELTDKVNID